MIGTALAYFVAIEHIGFLILEMFLWQHPIGRKVFRQSAEKAAESAVLAKNQGLYNGFLAVGIGWALLFPDPNAVKLFLGFVIAAGVYGAATVNVRIAVVQALPAALALAVVFAGY